MAAAAATGGPPIVPAPPDGATEAGQHAPISSIPPGSAWAGGSLAEVLKNSVKVAKHPEIVIPNRPSATIDGKPAILFTPTEISAGIKQMQFALIAKFSAGKPTIPVIKQHILSHWSLTGPVTVGSLDARHALLMLKSEKDVTEALACGSHQIGHSLFRLFRWSPDFNARKECSTTSTWVRIPRLSHHFFNEGFLRKIGNELGRYLKADERTLDYSIPSYARLCVEVDLALPLQNEIFVGCKVTGVGEWRDIVYEGKLLYCTRCRLQGHSLGECRKVAKPKPDQNDGVRVGGTEVPLTGANGTPKPAQNDGVRPIEIKVPMGRTDAIVDSTTSVPETVLETGQVRTQLPQKQPTWKAVGRVKDIWSKQSDQRDDIVKEDGSSSNPFAVLGEVNEDGMQDSEIQIPVKLDFHMSGACDDNQIGVFESVGLCLKKARNPEFYTEPVLVNNKLHKVLKRCASVSDVNPNPKADELEVAKQFLLGAQDIYDIYGTCDVMFVKNEKADETVVIETPSEADADTECAETNVNHDPTSHQKTRGRSKTPRPIFDDQTSDDTLDVVKTKTASRRSSRISKGNPKYVDHVVTQNKKPDTSKGGPCPSTAAGLPNTTKAKKRNGGNEVGKPASGNIMS